MKQSVLYYCAIALVVLGSVVFGLDWQSATLSPMPPFQVVALAPPPPPPPIQAAPAASSAPRPQTAAPSAAVSPMAPTGRVVPQPIVPALAPAAQTPPKPESPKPEFPKPESPKPLCDMAACAAAYRSFRESDCTYNPSFGARRLCTKGVVPTEASAAPAPDVTTIMNPEPGVNPSSNAPSNAQCNVNACAAAFRSFTASDCTYQPSDGPRRLCAK